MNNTSSTNWVAIQTFWGKCKMDDQEPPWTLRWCDESGFSAISSKELKLGDLIVQEYPTTWTPAWHPFTQADIIRIEEDIELLPTEKQKAFYEMSNVYDDIESRSAGIYMTNAFDMPGETETESKASGMFLAIARLNHSCTPNTQQTYIPPSSSGKLNTDGDADVGYEVLHATRHIGVGEELCDCYIELRQSTIERRKELQQYYRFICTCAACGPVDDAAMTPEQLKLRKEDDLRRKRALKLDSDILQYVEMGELEAAIDLGEELTKLLEHEKSRGWGERYIAEACMTTSTLLSEMGKRKGALSFAIRAHEWNVRLQGEFSPESRASAERLRELQIHN